MIVFWSIVGWGFLIASIIAAVTGNWLPAIWFAVMYTGWTNSMGHVAICKVLSR